MIHLIAELKIGLGARDAVLDLALPCIAETRKEPGCISYDLTQSLTDPESLVFVERWKDRQSLEAHFSMPHLVAFRDASAEHVIDRKIEIVEDGRVEIL